MERMRDDQLEEINQYRNHFLQLLYLPKSIEKLFMHENVNKSLNQSIIPLANNVITEILPEVDRIRN